MWISGVYKKIDIGRKEELLYKDFVREKIIVY